METYDVFEELGELDNDDRSSKRDPIQSISIITVFDV